MRVPALLIGPVLLLGSAVATTPAGARAVPAVAVVTAGHTLRTGQQLVSPNGRYRAALDPRGRLVVRAPSGRHTAVTPATARGAALTLARSGQLTVHKGGRHWSAGTSGAGPGVQLRLRDDGVVAVRAAGLTVWTSRVRAGCPARAGRTFVVDLGDQLARMCSGGQQLRVTAVTTGASARGYATPRGTWRVQHKVRDTTLYPAAGGAYPVRYWVPYDGPYGVHDSSWQRFAYGSSTYRTQGSHGCTHLPGAAMAWFYRWVRVGTTVTVHG